MLPLLLAAAQGAVPYPAAPSWESYPGGVTTGGAFADLDRDGWLDLVVANGNDILRQRVEVYFNDGAGGYPATPSWSAGDVDYHGHLAVGDVDGDGWEDVAVAVFLGPGGFGSLGRVKLYRNLGGALESTPSWSSADRFYAFSCAFGDADSDGDLDLAVAVGEPYFGAPDVNRIYYNVGGALQAAPGWTSALAQHALDCGFADVDGDGDHDLAFCTAAGPSRVHFQGPGGIAAGAGWTSTDNPLQNGNTLSFGDVDADGDLDLAVSDNDQLSGGSGRFKIYRNLGATFATAPFWSSYGGMVSAVAFADLHLDGHPDLAGGIWFAGSRVYANDSGTFPNSWSWRSTSNSTVEALDFADTRNLALRTRSDLFPAAGGRRGFRLSGAPVHEILAVRLDGAAVGPDRYCWSRADGWIALDAAPAATLEVLYRHSESLDMLVTNWDQSIGNQVFRRDPLVVPDATPAGPTVVPPGGTLDVDVALRSTTGRTEDFDYWLFARRPGGPASLILRQARTLAPFGTDLVHHSLQVPIHAPPGVYELHAGITEGGNRLADDFFAFTVQ